MVDPSTIEVPRSIIWHAGKSEPQVYYQAVKLTGPRILFWYTQVLLGKDSTPNYSLDVVVDAEVLSPARIKVVENEIWRYWTMSPEPVLRDHTYETKP
jgi:hypothetical protein